MKTVDRLILSAIAVGLFLNAFKATPPISPSAVAAPPKEEIVAVDIVSVGGRALTFPEIPVKITDK